MTLPTIRPLSCLAMALVASVVSAQGTQTGQQRKFAPRDFMIPNYENLMFADIKLMREREIWDELESSAIKLMFKEMERELGFPIDDLDRATASVTFGGAKGGGMRSGPVDSVRVLEGNKPLPMHESMANNRWQSEQVGDFEVWRRKGTSEDVFVQPCDTMHVWGSSAALLPALEKRRIAVPSAGVMSFLSGRDATLACFVFGLDHPETRKRFLDDLFEDAEWPAGDAPQLLGVRVLATGDEDDPHLTLEAVLRHKQAGEGLKTTEGLVDGLLEKLTKNPQMRMMRPLLQKIVKAVDGTELVLRLDLGRVRNAVGHLTMFAVPVLMGGEARAKAAQDSPQKKKSAAKAEAGGKR